MKKIVTHYSCHHTDHYITGIIFAIDVVMILIMNGNLLFIIFDGHLNNHFDYTIPINYAPVIYTDAENLKMVMINDIIVASSSSSSS